MINHVRNEKHHPTIRRIGQAMNPILRTAAHGIHMCHRPLHGFLRSQFNLTVFQPVAICQAAHYGKDDIAEIEAEGACHESEHLDGLCWISEPQRHPVADPEVTKPLVGTKNDQPYKATTHPETQTGNITYLSSPYSRRSISCDLHGESYPRSSRTTAFSTCETAQ